MKKLYNKAKRFVLLFLWLACSHAVLAQERVVTGTVKDESGGTMPGVNVLVSGTSNGTVTDASGKFSISVGSGARLSFSFIGYTSQEVAVGSSTTLNVSMKTDVTELVEVVVTGYASQQKRDITGSVAVVDIKDMTKIASSNFGDQLQGKVAGVQVGTSGDPGSSQMVRIRGIGTINNNEPLYVIDGVPVQNEANMNFLNPNDIESMQVLKDAASASIYGSRAANGVVVITTKKGKSGNSKLSIDYFAGFASPGSKSPEIANPTELLEIVKGLHEGAKTGKPFDSNFYVNQGGTFVLPDYFTKTKGFAEGAPEVDPAKYFLNPDPNGDASINYLIAKANKEGTDWFKEVFKPANQQSFQLSASGGSDKGNYFFSANYYNHNGILIENFYKRYQVRMNTTFNIKDKIRVGENLNIAYQTTQGSVGNPNEGSAIKNMYAMPQIVPVFDIRGYFAGPAALPSNAGNPVTQQMRSAANDGNHSLRVTGNVFAEIDILKNFTAKTSFGLDYGVGFNQFYGFRNYDATEVNSSNRLDQSAYNNRNWVWFNTLAYNKEFGDHKVTALIGSEAKHIFYEGINAGGAKLTFGDDPFYRLLGNTDSKSYTIGSYRGENRVSSLFAQANYTFSDKYLASATVRRDGSSRFLNNRYGVFPAASLGWRISKESFMANMDFINELKLRASYGATGNNETNGDYPGFNNYGTSPGLASYDINGTGNSVVPGFEQTSTGNPNLRWESTKLFNIGFDATLIDNLDLSVEYFDRKTEDMIYGVTLPHTGGQVGVRNENIGTMQNKGLEMALTYRGKAMGGDLSYTIGLNGTTVKNEVLNLDANSNSFVRSGGSRIGDITYTKAGLPISQYYGFIAEGLWTNQSEINTTLFTAVGDAAVGRMKFRDLNNDGQINSDDETFIGSPLPKLLMGLNLTASYKNFDFTLFLNGSYGQKVYNFMKYFIDFPAFQGNYSKAMLYEAGKSLPVLDRNDNYSPQRSSIYVEDGSWTRLRNLQIGYALPSATLSKMGFDKVRVYVQGQNLFTFTKYSGLDPDVTISNITEGFTGRRDLSLGVDYGRYPWARTIILGVNLGL
jgi:TonB-dependent starch-binding outer membrane protein SusC